MDKRVTANDDHTSNTQNRVVNTKANGNRFYTRVEMEKFYFHSTLGLVFAILIIFSILLVENDEKEERLQNGQVHLLE